MAEWSATAAEETPFLDGCDEIGASAIDWSADPDADLVTPRESARIDSMTADGAASDTGRGYLDLTGGVRGPAGEDPRAAAAPELVAEVDDALENLGTTMMVLLATRKDQLRRLAVETEPTPIDSRGIENLTLGASLALGAATAGFGGAIGVAASAELADAYVKEFVKSAVKDAIDDGLNGRVRPCVMSYVQPETMEDARLAFFHGAADALSDATPLVAADIRNPSRKKALLQLYDPAGQLNRANEIIQIGYPQARETQYRSGLLQWCDTMAHTDLGVDPETGNTEMAGTYRDDGLGMRMFEAEPAGVLRVYLEGPSPHLDPVVAGAEMAGTNPAMLRHLARETPETAGLPVEIDAHLTRMADSGVRVAGFAEIGIDEGGATGLVADENADGWLGMYASGESDLDEVPDSDGSNAIAGAARLTDRVIRNTTFGALGVKVG